MSYLRLAWGEDKDDHSRDYGSIPSINADKVCEHKGMVEKESGHGFCKYEDQMKLFLSRFIIHLLIGF